MTNKQRQLKYEPSKKHSPCLSRHAKLILAATFVAGLAVSPTLDAAPRTELKPVLADTNLLDAAGAHILATDQESGVSYAQITPEVEARLSRLAHASGKCGGFEVLHENGLLPASLTETSLQNIFGAFSERRAKDQLFESSPRFLSAVTKNPAIESALSQVSEENVRATVQFLSSYPTRVHRTNNPNEHVLAFKSRIEAILAGSSLSYQVELVDHSSTRQKSLRVRILGAARPSEIVVLGGHLDSISQDWMGSKNAPGADDNASGSADLLEALRILSRQGQPSRTVDFFWYAGEEGGLLGSAEIAQTYKSAKADVIGVLQLDMTLFPGAGEFTLGSMTDFTSAWLRSYLEDLNTTYIKARIVNDRCGYGCSDHASWHRQGYPAIIPFEATFNSMNHDLHTTRDIITSTSNFRHSAMFAKIALAFAMDLANSTARE
jgi:leucyl aminopeptidase